MENQATVILLAVGLMMGNMAKADEFSFVHLSDTHLGHGAGHPIVEKTVAKVKELKPDFVVLTGDIVELGIEEHWAYYEPLLKTPFASLKLYPITGNHETAWSGLEGKNLYRKHAGETRYSFTQGDWQFVALDSAVHNQHHGHIGEEQLAWLAKELAQSKAPHKVVLMHHPPFREKWTRYIDDEAELYSIMRAQGVRLVLSGHGHKNELWHYKGILMVMSGAAYQQGFAEFKVKGRGLSLTFYDYTESGQVEKRKPIELLTDEGYTNSKMVKSYNEEDLPRADADPMPEGVELLWRKSYKVPAQAPALVTADTVFLPLNDGTLRALEVASGEEKWQVKIGGDALAQPVLADGMVMVGGEAGMIVALHAASGDRAWDFKLESSVGGAAAAVGRGFAFGSGGGDVHIFSGEGRRTGKHKSGGNVCAQGASHGELRTSANGTVQGEHAYFTNWGGKVFAIDEQGQEIWKRQLSESWSTVYHSPGRCHPLLVAGVLVITTGGEKVLGLDPADGETLWEIEEKVAYSSPVLYKKGEKHLVLVGTGDGRLVAYEPKKGKKKFEIDIGAGSTSSRVAVSGDRAYMVSYGGGLHCLDLKKRKVLWKAYLGTPYIFSDPVADGDVVYVGNMGGEFFAIKDKF